MTEDIALRLGMAKWIVLEKYVDERNDIVTTLQKHAPEVYEALKSVTNYCSLCDYYLWDCDECPLGSCSSGSDFETYVVTAGSNEERRAAARRIIAKMQGMIKR